MTLKSPFTAPEDYICVIGKEQLRGRVEVTGVAVKNSWDKKPGVDHTKATSTFKGQDLLSWTVTCTVISDADIAWMESFVQGLKPEKSYEFGHALLRVYKVATCLVEDIDGPNWDDAKTMMTLSLKCSEWVAAPKVQKPNTPNKSSGGWDKVKGTVKPVGGDSTGNGSTVIPTILPDNGKPPDWFVKALT